VPGTVAAMILYFVYRCGGSDGIAGCVSPDAPSSRLIPGFGNHGDTCERSQRVGQLMTVVKLLKLGNAPARRVLASDRMSSGKIPSRQNRSGR